MIDVPERVRAKLISDANQKAERLIQKQMLLYPNSDLDAVTKHFRANAKQEVVAGIAKWRKAQYAKPTSNSKKNEKTDKKKKPTPAPEVKKPVDEKLQEKWEMPTMNNGISDMTEDVTVNMQIEAPKEDFRQCFVMENDNMTPGYMTKLYNSFMKRSYQ